MLYQCLYGAYILLQWGVCVVTCMRAQVCHSPHRHPERQEVVTGGAGVSSQDCSGGVRAQQWPQLPLHRANCHRQGVAPAARIPGGSAEGSGRPESAVALVP